MFVRSSRQSTNLLPKSQTPGVLPLSELKAAMGSDAERAVHCLEKDLESLLVEGLENDKPH
jgi:hypothetical protein